MGEEKRARLIKVGEYYINPSRIDGVVEISETETEIYVGGCDTPYVLSQPIQEVVRRLRKLGVEIAS